MKITVKRIFKGEKYTIGHMYLDGKYFCDTLEDVVRPDGTKVYGQTAIPAGKYPCKLTYSPRFKKILPHIMNVPNFEGVRIHSGNTDADTEGCILVGENKVVGRVVQSRATMNKLMELLDKENIIEIV